MDEHNSRDFDYGAAEADAKASLAESPPTGLVLAPSERHLDRGVSASARRRREPRVSTF
jgi:hypothetical protein